MLLCITCCFAPRPLRLPVALVHHLQLCRPNPLLTDSDKPTLPGPIKAHRVKVSTALPIHSMQ